LPDGKTVLFTIGKAGNPQIAALSLETGAQKIIFEGGRHATYVDTGYLVYNKLSTLMAVPFDLASLEVTGKPATVLHNVRFTIPGGTDYAVSAAGTVVYVTSSIHMHRLVWVDRQGRETS
jgi:hypothetical protein